MDNQREKCMLSVIDIISSATSLLMISDLPDSAAESQLICHFNVSGFSSDTCKRWPKYSSFILACHEYPRIKLLRLKALLCKYNERVAWCNRVVCSRTIAQPISLWIFFRWTSKLARIVCRASSSYHHIFVYLEVVKRNSHKRQA